VCMAIQIADGPEQRGIDRERSREEVQSAATDRQSGSAGVNRTTGGLEFRAPSRQRDIEVWKESVPPGQKELRADVTEAEMSGVPALATLAVEGDGEPLSHAVGDHHAAAGDRHTRRVRRLAVQFEGIGIGADDGDVSA